MTASLEHTSDDLKNSKGELEIEESLISYGLYFPLQQFEDIDIERYLLLELLPFLRYFVGLGQQLGYIFDQEQPFLQEQFQSWLVLDSLYFAEGLGKA